MFRKFYMYTLITRVFNLALKKALPIIILFLFTNCIFAQSPTITSFSPLNGKPGDAVTITGTNFSSTNTNNLVFFGATKAIVTSSTTTSITATVPLGATYAPISVLNANINLAAQSNKNFTPSFNPVRSTLIAGNFIEKEDFTSNNSAEAMVVGDIDEDGKADLAITAKAVKFWYFAIQHLEFIN